MRSNHLRGVAAVAVLTSLLSTAAAAQWINYPTPGTPRLPDGKPDLLAPAPRTADGKPDLSGVWRGAGPLYRYNIAQDLKPEDIQPWAEALFLQASPGFPEGQSPGALSPGQRPVPRFLRFEPDRPDAGAHRHAVRVAQRPASSRVHRRPRSSQGSESRMARVLGRAMGGGHAGGDDGRVQRQGLARQRRTSANGVPSHYRTPAPPRLRPHGFRNHDRRSKGVYPAVHRQDGSGCSRRTPTSWRTSARTSVTVPISPATPESD